MVDTSTEAVTKLLDGVTPGTWWCMDYTTEDPINAGWYVVPHDAVGTIAKVNPALGDDASFIAAARDLVPALLAERDALLRENENLRQIERNVQAVREHEYKRAEAALAEVERLKSQPVTVQDAANVPRIAAERDAYKLRGDNHWETMRCIYRIATVEGDIEAIIQHIKDAGQGYTERPEDTLRHYQTEVARLTSELAALRAIAEGKA